MTGILPVTAMSEIDSDSDVRDWKLVSETPEAASVPLEPPERK